MPRQSKKLRIKKISKGEAVAWIVFGLFILVMDIFLKPIGADGQPYHDPGFVAFKICFSLLLAIAPLVRIRQHIRISRSQQTETKAPKDQNQVRIHHSGNYLILDVQTPNSLNDRICEMGVTMISDGSIKMTREYGINPETSWDESNSLLHGIWPKDVADAPTLPVIWKQLKPLLKHSVVIAHNAQFDLAVLGKALNHYGIHPKPLLYLDTCELAKKYYPTAPNRKLVTLCAMQGIKINSANGLGHAFATAELALDMFARGMSKHDVYKWVFKNHLNDSTYIWRR